MKLALFDLDNTLLSGDTDFEWLNFLVEAGGAPASALRANEEMDRRYSRGGASPLEYVRFYLSYYPPHDLAKLEAWRERFLAEKIAARILPAARELIESHRADLRVVITATNRFLTQPIAALLGIENLIATEPEILRGRFTGEVVGVPCMQAGKIERLDAWLASRGQSLARFGSSHFYSDSVNDLPLLERVTHPVAVDADEKLREIARSRGWRMVTLR